MRTDTKVNCNLLQKHNESRSIEKDYSEIIMIFADTITNLKQKEQSSLKGKKAFFNMLEDVSALYKDLENFFMNFMKTMVNALDAKSPWTKGHSERVAHYAEQIAIQMGLDDEEYLRNLRFAGILHDIGKIGTYDYLLDKSDKLTDEEYEIVKKHPGAGASILREIKQLKNIIPIIRHHHERFDGQGYPAGLSGDDIPLCSRILHVADSFDSMTSDRPYRRSPGIEYAISEFKKHSGSQFDPEVVGAFLEVIYNLPK